MASIGGRRRISYRKNNVVSRYRVERAGDVVAIFLLKYLTAKRLIKGAFST